ncbi:H(+)-transporting V0 sector ATPase subunit d [Actinomortierella ambigua]|uniref:V-type proton ATPase subunit n=1 Tax=Actinomortierella ambigua TaxID=1343610 RepID=A0A9P6UD39_9FUNG|nr:H(+)-transporting V0 sector ATPase subunit d [Actinomortierella ambigua]KAG0270035.1 H(+)-transporting V0 sector ATPase subunit d [Actinomortierella ambigua]
MEGLYYNVDNGYLEGIVRGYRANILTNSFYVNLTQSETLDDVKLQLSASEYGPVLQNEAHVSTSLLAQKFTEKMVQEFEYIRAHAVGDLQKFLDYITYAYMIDNVILLITGTLHERDTRELLDRCHPLGVFDSMPALCVATNVAELYNTVLVETPLAPYFKDCLSAEDLDEMNIEIIRNTLYKAYLEDFYNFSKSFGGATAEIMAQLLEFEADRRTLNITINSFGTELTKDDRAKLFPNIGRLYPEGSLKLAKADDNDQVKMVCDVFLEYRQFFEGTMGVGAAKTLEDRFFEYEVHLNKVSFQQQFHYAIYYSFLKLKEQEIRNLVWIAECISQGQKERINNFIPIF